MSRSVVKRVVVKVGSAVVAPGGRVDGVALDRICDELAGLVGDGMRVVLVSSGAVASGFRALGLAGMPSVIRQKQAAAAIGQPALMRGYSERLGRRGVAAAQVLLTRDDFGHRERFLNARHTLETLLDAGVVPIVNENDSVVFDEIKLGDNDRLSALVAAAIDADLLVLLSSVRGLMDTARGEVIARVDDVSAARRFVDEAMSSGVGTGGMATKLDAAGIAVEHGIRAVLAGGPSDAVADPVGRIVRGKALGTEFVAGGGGLAARKSWIAHAAAVGGSVVVDDGAARALVERGASLLPKGIVSVRGRFDVGAAVDVVDASGAKIARGLVSYSSDDIERILGIKSDAIAEILEYAYSDEVIHRDDLRLTGGGR